MGTKNSQSEIAILDKAQVALDNVTSQPDISLSMTEVGYDVKKIEEGKVYLTNAQTAYKSNKAEDDETSAAFKLFSDHRKSVYDIYGLQRKKAKVIFRNDSLAMDKLNISGSIPTVYLRKVDAIETFYTSALADESIQEKLSELHVAVEDLNKGMEDIKVLRKLRSEYLREKGESQEATQVKDEAFSRLCEWLSEFYAIARIALEDKPQLLEALGKSISN